MANNAFPGCKGMIEIRDDRVGVDGDIIAIEVHDIPTDRRGGKSLQIRLALAPTVTWWKMLQVVVVDYDANRNVIKETVAGQAELQDDNKGPVLVLDNYYPAKSEPPPATFELRFWKAKFLGVHTDMEHWNMRGADLLGKRVTFNWLIDY